VTSGCDRGGIHPDESHRPERELEAGPDSMVKNSAGSQFVTALRSEARTEKRLRGRVAKRTDSSLA